MKKIIIFIITMICCNINVNSQNKPHNNKKMKLRTIKIDEFNKAEDEYIEIEKKDYILTKTLHLKSESDSEPTFVNGKFVEKYIEGYSVDYEYKNKPYIEVYDYNEFGKLYSERNSYLGCRLECYEYNDKGEVIKYENEDDYYQFKVKDLEEKIRDEFNFFDAPLNRYRRDVSRKYYNGDKNLPFYILRMNGFEYLIDGMTGEIIYTKDWKFLGFSDFHNYEKEKCLPAIEECFSLHPEKLEEIKKRNKKINESKTPQDTSKSTWKRL